MNDKSKLIFRTGTVLAVCTAIAAAVLYAISYSTAYDITIRHFNASPSVTAFIVLFVISTVTFIFTAISLRRHGQLKEKAPNQIESFILWLTAFMFVGFGVISISGSSAVLASSESKMAFGSFCTAASGPLAILSAIPFICAVSSRLRGGIIHAVSSFFPVLWGSCLMFKYYFDLSEMPLNDPELSITSVCIAAMIFFFLSESRSALGINTPAIALFSDLCIICLTGCVATARILLSITHGHSIPSLMENIIFFTAAALAVARLISFESKVPEIINPEYEFDSSCDEDSEI